MRKRVFLSVLLVLSLGLILVGCGGGGGGDDGGGGGNVCFTTDFVDTDLIGTWVDPTALCVQPPQNSPCDFTINGNRFNGLLTATTTVDPDWFGTIKRNPDGQVQMTYSTFDVNFNTTNGDIFGQVTCDKTQIIFNRITWSTSNTGPGEETISRVFTRQ